MPDLTYSSAASAVLSRFLYSISHDIDILFRSLAGPQHVFPRLASHFFFIPYGCIVNRPVEKHLEHLQQFQLSHDLDSTVHDRFALEELPQILFRENNRLHDFAQRNVLASTPGSNLTITMLDIELILAQQPFSEVAVDFVDAFLKFMGGNFAEMRDLQARLDSFFQSGSERVGVRLDQTHQPIGEHHTHPLVLVTSPGYTPSFTVASSSVQPSTGTLIVSTTDSSVCGTVMAREIMHTDLVRRNSVSPASRWSSECTVKRGRIRISVKLHP